MQPHYKIVETAAEYATARRLFVAYAAWLGIDLCFQDFDSELREIEEVYSPASGGIFIAFVNNLPVGCSALRPMQEPGACELKRMYVDESYRGLGIGENLLRLCISLARDKGYKTILLDTLDTLKPAIALYKKYGFTEVLPYYYNPNSNTVYMQLLL